MGFACGFLVLHELLHLSAVFGVCLALEEVRKLNGSLAVLLLFLLLGKLQLFVANAPELGELLLLLFSLDLVLLLALNLKCAASVDCRLHLGLSALLLLEESVRLVLGLSHLAIEYLLLVVLQSL